MKKNFFKKKFGKKGIKNNKIDKYLSSVMQDCYNKKPIIEYFNNSFSLNNNQTNIEYTAMLKNNIIHELAHAMDYNSEDGYSFARKPEYYETFEKELYEYINSGNLPYGYATKKGSTNSNTEGINYCTADIMEMFAECYTLLMLGNCPSKNCILKHFPQTLKNVNNHIKYIRSLQQEVRHKKIT